MAEFWFPRLGGWTQFGEDRTAALAQPGYGGCGHWSPLFKHFPGGQGLGSEAAEFSSDYPGMVMPWWSIHDPKSNKSLYMGYHDKTMRLSTWHMYLMPTSTGSPADSFLTPEQAKGQPVGLVFSHVRYPFIRSGETFDTRRVHHPPARGRLAPGGEVLPQLVHGALPVRQVQELAAQAERVVHVDHLPARGQASSPTSRPTTAGAADAKRFGVNTYELIGWHKGGLERGYPEYVPEPKTRRPGRVPQDDRARSTSATAACWPSSTTTSSTRPPTSTGRNSNPTRTRTSSARRPTGWPGARARCSPARA